MASSTLWLIFGAVLAPMLLIDLFAHRGEHGKSIRSAAIWAAIWISVGLLFAGVVAWKLGHTLAREYLAAYLIEKSLSLDNMFVFVVIFGALGVPPERQHRVLVLGILGALVMRGLFIFVGVAAIERWSFLEIVLGVILIVTAIRVVMKDPTKGERSRVVEWLERRLPFTPVIESGHFIVRRNGKLVATPLLVALIAIELTDVAFAIDSIPAAFAVTRSEFVLYASNAFAILGLRSLYILVAGSLTRLSKLHYGLGAVLVFAGVELVIARWVRVDPLVSIAVIVGAIGLSVVASVWRPRRRGRPARPTPPASAPSPPKSVSTGAPG
jgi:tellurite resistance protein TerC